MTMAVPVGRPERSYCRKEYKRDELLTRVISYYTCCAHLDDELLNRCNLFEEVLVACGWASAAVDVSGVD